MKGLEYGKREERPIYLKIAADLAQNMARYSYPKLKAVEMQKDTVVDVMSPQQKLAAMREAVALLEKQVDAEIDQPKVPEIIEKLKRDRLAIKLGQQKPKYKEYRGTGTIGGKTYYGTASQISKKVGRFQEKLKKLKELQKLKSMLSK